MGWGKWDKLVCGGREGGEGGEGGREGGKEEQSNTQHCFIWHIHNVWRVKVVTVMVFGQNQKILTLAKKDTI